jgi:hypothetical protein
MGVKAMGGVTATGGELKDNQRMHWKQQKRSQFGGAPRNLVLVFFESEHTAVMAGNVLNEINAG